MNVRDPLFTARLEEALNMVAQQPSRMLHYIEDRFELETGEIARWLNEFNGGQRALKLERIYEVKRQLARAAAPAKSALAAPVPAQPAAIVPTEPAPQPSPAVAPRAPAPAPKPAAPAAKPASDEKPWENTCRQFRGKVFQSWRAALEALAAGQSVLEASSLVASGTPMALAGYCESWLGARQNNPPEHIRSFIAWADAQCGESASTRPAQPVVKPAVVVVQASAPEPAAVAPWLRNKIFKTSAYIRWRPLLLDLREPGRKLSSVCRKHQVPREQFEKYAHFWMGSLRDLTPETVKAFTAWADEECGPLLPSAPKPATEPKPDLAAPATAQAVSPSIIVGGSGTLFRLEISVRLVPVGGGEVTL